MVKKGMPFPFLHLAVLKQLFPDNAEVIAQIFSKVILYLRNYILLLNTIMLLGIIKKKRNLTDYLLIHVFLYDRLSGDNGHDFPLKGWTSFHFRCYFLNSTDLQT